MGLIKGIDVVLYEKEKIGTDKFNRSIYKENEIVVENVLVYPVSNDEIVNELSLTGKKASYVLCIPKGDTYNWLNSKVKFFDKEFLTFGFYTEYIEDNIPLKWNKKIYCDIYG